MIYKSAELILMIPGLNLELRRADKGRKGKVSVFSMDARTIHSNHSLISWTCELLVTLLIDISVLFFPPRLGSAF
jgi:ferredoxin-fold anticodon binding domain-containing protein